MAELLSTMTGLLFVFNPTLSALLVLILSLYFSVCQAVLQLEWDALQLEGTVRQYFKSLF